MQPDSLIPDPSNPQAWNRFSYVVNNSVNLNDPTGHKYNPCKGAASGYKCHRELDRQRRDEQIRQDKIVKGFGFNNLLDFQRWTKDNKIQNPDILLGLQMGNSSGTGEDEGGANWLLDRYMLGWKNAGQAWTIVSNSNESFVRRLGASAYLTGWVGFGHIGLALGLTGLGCAALIAGCATAVGTGGPILIQGFARGGPQWHVGLETVENMNIAHIGNHIKFGVHFAFGAVEPYVANFHIYFEKAFPFFRTWKPGG